MAEHWITTNEAEEISGYHINHIRRLIRQDRIVAKKFGPIWQVSKSSLLAYLATAEASDDNRWGPKE